MLGRKTENFKGLRGFLHGQESGRKSIVIRSVRFRGDELTDISKCWAGPSCRSARPSRSGVWPLARNGGGAQLRGTEWDTEILFTPPASTDSDTVIVKPKYFVLLRWDLQGIQNYLYRNMTEVISGLQTRTMYHRNHSIAKESKRKGTIQISQNYQSNWMYIISSV